MTHPAGVGPLCAGAAVVALILPCTALGTASREERLEVIKAGVRRHDRAFHEKKPAPPPVKTEAERLAEAWRRAEEAVPTEAPRPKPVPKDEGTLELPKMTVRSTTEPIKRLPRIEPRSPPRKDLQPGPYETPSGRDARLVKRHLSKAQAALISFFGGSPVAAAREAERLLQQAAQMDDLATSLELQEAAGRDPEDIKKLRAEYLKLYYSGPKR